MPYVHQAVPLAPRVPENSFISTSSTDVSSAEMPSSARPVPTGHEELEIRNKEMMDALRPHAEAGDYMVFWAVAKGYGDPLAQLALDFHDGVYGANLPNSYAISSLELNWSRTFSNGERLDTELLKALKSTVGRNLMLHHYEQLRTDIELNIGVPGYLSVKQIDQYHYDYFESIGLPKHTYGGYGGSWHFLLSTM